jgi:putative DNA methylase
MITKKKLIEVALPLEAINIASAREKSIRHGHPSTLHLWWARRPLATARAVIFAQMVDDPSAHPDLFPTEKAQEKERQRLFRIIEKLVLWENTTNEEVLQEARDEIWQSWRYTCAENADDPRAKELFDRHKLPKFHDPFAGGGSIPLEAQRLGLESYASDLNPVAVLINKAMIEIPPTFASNPPVNPESLREHRLLNQERSGAQGLAEDVLYYGKWMREEAEKRVGHLYPKIQVTADMINERPDLKPYLGNCLTVIAWLWVRTVRSPNPAFSQVEVPLASSFMLSSKGSTNTYVKPVINGGCYLFTVRRDKSEDAEAAKSGTKLGRGANFRCLMSDTPISGDYIKAEGKAGRMGARMMAIVADGGRERIYLPPTEEMQTLAGNAKPGWKPEIVISGSTQYLGIKPYGMDKFSQLFQPRQLVTLNTFSDLVQDARELIKRDALIAGIPDDSISLELGGTGASAYADAVSVYLGETVSKMTSYHCAVGTWRVKEGKTAHAFGRQALPMVWDFPECNPFAGAGGDWDGACQDCARVVARLGLSLHGHASQSAAQIGVDSFARSSVVSTDPPYYDNVPYADLSDFFYVWLRRSLGVVFPTLFATLAVPKLEELVAFVYRHNSKTDAEAFFLDGMTQAMRRLAEQVHPAFPVTIYYAFKQSESDEVDGTTSTGWETFLEAVIRAGFAVTGTWPMRTEQPAALKTTRNALASSIILVCRPRAATLPVVARRELSTALADELPLALTHLQRGNIAPVDLAQAVIGPGMAVYTRYARVLDAQGKPLSVREALAMINRTLDEALAEQEGDFDGDSRWALAWFADRGFDDGPYGDAHTYFLRFNTAENALATAGIIKSGRGKVRLLRPDELSTDWDPSTDSRLTTWQVVHHLIRSLETGGEIAAASLVSKLGTNAEVARELAYRLYTLCERKKWAAEALSYNGLVLSWPEITRLAHESQQPHAEQVGLFAENAE